MNLAEALRDAHTQQTAIGHFNVSNIEGVWAVVSAARKLRVPVVIGVSEGERAFFGVRQIRAVIESIREEFNLPVFLNADHTYSFEKVKEAVDAGFDMVIADGAKLSFRDNVEFTKRSVDYAKGKNPRILVEGELGYIGASSKILDAIPEGAALSPEELTSPEEAMRFVHETNIDLLAPAVGNIHGMLRSGREPKLNIGRIGELSRAAGVPLVLHGGSGGSEEDFRNAIAAGMRMIHISTELRVAFRRGLEQALVHDREEVAPYRYMHPAMDAMEQVVEKRLRLFSGS